MKIENIFERDFKRKFEEIETVEEPITALDIDEYIMTNNAEQVIGNIAAYFFDDSKLYPNLKMQVQFLQEDYRDYVGPGVWIRGFFGSGKSHLLKIMHSLFTYKKLDYKEDNQIKELDVIHNIQSKIKNEKIRSIVGNINSEDYLTFMFSANHVTKSNEHIIDALPRIIGEFYFKDDFEENSDGYTAQKVVNYLKEILAHSGKKRMLIFIDEFLDFLDDTDKIKKFEALMEVIPKEIWFFVTSLEAKNQKIEVNTAERMKDRFGNELILQPEEMVKIIKDRYLEKKQALHQDILNNLESIDKYKYLFSKAYSIESDDGAITKENLIGSYPFYPFQLAYLKELLKNESKGSSRNLMKITKNIITNPSIYSQKVGYFIEIDTIFETMKDKKGIASDFGDLIKALHDNPLQGDYSFVKDMDEYKNILLKVLKALVLLAQVSSSGVTLGMLFAFAFDNKAIKEEENLKDYLQVLANENYISSEGGYYRPVTKQESDVWTKIKGIKAITESDILGNMRDRIYKKIFNLSSEGNKYIVKGKLNGFEKIISFNLKVADESSELPNIYSCVPTDRDLENLKAKLEISSSDKEKMFIVPSVEKSVELYNLVKYYLQIQEALDRAADFGIDQKLRIQVENARDLRVNTEIQSIMEKAFKNATIVYRGTENKDFNKEISDRLNEHTEALLKNKFSKHFGTPFRQNISDFIKKEILQKPVMSDSYLKDLDLIDSQGKVNTGNKAYNNYFMRSFESGIEKLGEDVIDEFSKGTYGWDLDIIKILTALAFKNGDLRISLESRTFSLNDTDELISNNGLFGARNRKAFDKYSLSKLSLPEEDKKDSIALLRELNPTVILDQNINNIANEIKKIFTANFLSYFQTLINNYKDFYSSKEFEIIKKINEDLSSIVRKADSVEVIKIFVRALNNIDSKEKVKSLYNLLSQENFKKLETLKKIYEQYDIDSTEKEDTKFYIKEFLGNDSSNYDKVIADYHALLNKKYNDYKELYEVYKLDLSKLDPWNDLSQGERENILLNLRFKSVSSLEFDLNTISLKGLGNLRDIKDLKSSLEKNKTIQIGRVFEIKTEIDVKKKVQEEKINKPVEEQNTSSSIVKEPEAKPLPKKKPMVSRKVRELSSKPAICIKSLEDIKNLEATFEEIKKRIIEELDKDNEITLMF